MDLVVLLRRLFACSWLIGLLALARSVPAVSETTVGTLPFDDFTWRLIGPFRGGRTVAVAGVPTQPQVFYSAPNNGGVWKSVDAGRTWQPIFDGEPTGSIGALAVAPSDPQIIYVGSGEGLRRPDLSTGDGMYRSGDAGKTWTHQGLRDGQQIAAIAVDPHNSARLFVAVAGHPYGPNHERGLYRSTDGGTTYERVLGMGDDIGAVDVALDPNHPTTVFAALWASRNGPWNLTRVYTRYRAGGLFKSIDGGATWVKLTRGLPADVGRIGLSISPADSNRLYAIVEKPDDGCGVFRSSDAGANWVQTTSEQRVCGRADDFAGITADPHDRDLVYSANTTLYRSSDAGTTWIGIKGAPGGDDYHTLWIDPLDATLLLGADQGATLSLDRGETWSSWYNQPTAQFYHVITDNRFPYRVFGSQQESGSAEVTSRGNDGAITSREFHPVGAEEYGYIAPDPLHPYLIYGGKTTVYDERTGQTRDVSPTYDRTRYRFDRTNPLVWNRVDHRTLYLGLNVVFATRDGGLHWQQISPDLTRQRPGEPATLAHFVADDPQNGLHRGVIYSLSPSYRDAKLIWAGTDDGRVWLTRDAGTHWRSVTPPALEPWSRVTQIDASHFDDATAYIAVSRQRLDDLHPYLYRTHDFGAHWQRITDGIPSNEAVNTVREDPQRRNLLFAGTERTVYFSYNDGARWQSLQRNLPATSIRDAVVQGDDLVVATHGRSFWILDDIAPLREMPVPVAAPARLYLPQRAYRVRANTNTDTPLPPDEPVGQNPPDGAIIDYYLAPTTNGPLSIAIDDARGHEIRRYASLDRASRVDHDITIPTYWVRPPAIPSAQPGDHRFIWDLHETAPHSLDADYPIAAIVHNTPLEPRGVWVLPGTYTVVLTVAGRTYRKPLKVVLDPRLVVSAAALNAQYALGRQIVSGLNASAARVHAAVSHHDFGGAKRFTRINAALTDLYAIVEGADVAPTSVQAAQAHQLLVSMLAAHQYVGNPFHVDEP